MEKRAFLAVVLSIAVLIVYQQWVRYHYGPQPVPVSRQKRRSARESLPLSPRSEVQQTKVSPVRAAPGAKDVRVETDHYVAVFTNLGARLKSFRLKHYRNSPDKSSGTVEIISPGAGGSYPLGVELKNQEAFSDDALIYAVQGSDLKLSGGARGEILFRGTTARGEKLSKRYRFAGSDYAIGIEAAVEGAKNPESLRLLLTSHANAPTKGANFEGMLALADDELIRESPKRVAGTMDLSREFSWIGFGYTYFLMALLPDKGGQEKVTMRQSGNTVTMSLERQGATEPDGKIDYTLFIGPKDLDVLKSKGRGLERSIDFGYFSLISIPLLRILRLSHRLTGGYGIDIILLTILIKLALAPLTHKSYVSMKRMKMLQPQMERIKEKFKDDKERLNREIMELYRRNQVNPLGGCLPMLVQMPVAVGGWNVGVPVLTLLMGASMFAQQWMNPGVTDPNQRRMMLFMPLLFTVMFINFPSGLTIYWLVNNALTIGYQYIINQKER